MSNYVCPVWLSSTLTGAFRKFIHNPYKILGDYVKKGYVVADIGCGPGYFTLPLAEMVGEQGRVIAADLQPEMLGILKERAERSSLQSRIVLHQCQPEKLGITEKVDFAMAFWMVHEVPDTKRFFNEIAAMLKPGALFLMVEPRIHTTPSLFRDEIILAGRAGLNPCSNVKVNISRAALFSLP